MIRDLGGVLEPLGLHQHHLQLGGGVDVHHLVVAILAAALVPALVPALLLAVVEQGAGFLRRFLEIVLVVIVLVIIGMNDLLQLVHKSHVQYLPLCYLE